jgi:hypothetical protein
MMMAGRLQLAPFQPVTVDPRRNGQVHWGINPFGDPTWFQDFQSGGWVEQLVAGYEAGGPHASAYRARAAAILRTWLRDVPLAARDPLALVCVSQAFPGQRWIQSQVRPAVDWYAAHWQGAWNHGLRQDLNLLHIGCGYPARSFGWAALRWRRTAVGQLIAAFHANPLGPAIDAQGAPNEQSMLYSDYVYNLWKHGLRELSACHYRLPGWMTARISRLPGFLAAAAQPNDDLVQLGDTYVEKSAVRRSHGRLVSLYGAGYVFGRSGWGRDASFYSLRFGPGRQIHGHDDHTSLTYYARGRNLIVNAGHGGYARNAYRAFQISPEASSNLVIPGVPFDEHSPTILAAHSISKRGQFYEFFDTAFDGDPRTRSVYVTQRPGLVLVYDQAAGAGFYQQLWHLDPALRITHLSRSYAVASAPGTELVLRQVPLPRRPIPVGSTRAIRGSRRPWQGWVSPQLRQRIPDSVVTMSRSGPYAQIVTVIAAAAPGTPVTATASGPPAGPWRIRVRIGRSTSAFRVTSGGVINH